MSPQANATMKPLSTPAANTLLADDSFDIEFNGYLSNHAKHAVIALDRLGAPVNRVQAYWDGYAALTPYNLPLHPVAQDWAVVRPATPADWLALRGKKQSWQELVALMNSDLDSSCGGDAAALVRTHAPPLLAGAIGALTHGIVHLGWALDAASPRMTAEGLAYLNFCNLGVDAAKLRSAVHADAGPMQSLVRVAQAVRAEGLGEEWVNRAVQKYGEEFHPELVPAGFQWTLAKVVEDAHPVATDLPAWIEKLSVDKLWEALYRATVWLYFGSRDETGHGSFLVLHTITSLWGLEKVCRVIDDERVTRDAVGSFYAGLVCMLAATGAYPGGGFPEASALEAIQAHLGAEMVDAAEMDWEPMVKKGIAEEEEHNIKIVYVLRELWNRYGRWTGFSKAATVFVLTPNIGPS